MDLIAHDLNAILFARLDGPTHLIGIGVAQTQVFNQSLLTTLGCGVDPKFNGSPMANQNLTEAEARAVLEYFRTL